MSFKDKAREARAAVDEAIDTLNMVPRTYGGHRSGEGTSMFDNIVPEHVMHRDGRIMRFERFIDGDVMAALCVYRGRWIVVPSYKLRAAQ